MIIRGPADDLRSQNFRVKSLDTRDALLYNCIKVAARLTVVAVRAEGDLLSTDGSTTAEGITDTVVFLASCCTYRTNPTRR